MDKFAKFTIAMPLIVLVGGAAAIMLARIFPAPRPASSAVAAGSGEQRPPGTSASPKQSAAPDPSTSVPDAGQPDSGGRSTKGPTWEVASPDSWLVGRWVSVEKGDAIPGGPLGGAIVSGGVRAEFVKGRPGSKTPWNVTFWAPTGGHMDSKTISGGCGFYESGVAFCKGHGLPVAKKALETRIALLVADGKLQFVVTDVVSSGALAKP